MLIMMVPYVGLTDDARSSHGFKKAPKLINNSGDDITNNTILLSCNSNSSDFY
uniref:Uncharacterized protein n=1 Tax=Rhizophagus irregularis (strain DAOM 181602 / DAOM 197198 / MUCL 43194) TaxID=747089 RepID=U9T8P6_RHIID